MKAFHAKPDPHAAAIVEAMLLRVGCRYMPLRQRLEDTDIDLGRHPALENGHRLSERYQEAMHEWVDHRPETASAALACVELAREILLREIGDDDPLIDERLDRVHAVELLIRVAEWTNERAAHELAAEIVEAQR